MSKGPGWDIKGAGGRGQRPFVLLFPALTTGDCAEERGDAVRKPKVAFPHILAREEQRGSANEKNANLGGEILHLASLMRDQGDQERGRLQLWMAGEDPGGRGGQVLGEPA